VTTTLETMPTPTGPVAYTEMTWQDSWVASTAKVVMVFDHAGRLIDRYRLREDHDGGDEQP
jgi:hypothetical protein